MAYDEGLAHRIREHLGETPGITEKRMFGGLAFLLDGNMLVGARGDELIVRVGADAASAALARPGTGGFRSRGRAMRGWFVVDVGALSEDEPLHEWIDEALAFVSGLPPKGISPEARTPEG